MKQFWISALILSFLLTPLTGCIETGKPKETESPTVTEPLGSDVPSTVLPETELPETELPETESTPESALDCFRETMEDGSFCGVAYLGYVDGSYSDIMTHIEGLGVLDVFPFLAVPEENYIGIAGGDLYVIVPADPMGKITVYSAVLDETDYTMKPDEKLAEFSSGEPILLKCNVSEIMPNQILEIQWEGESVMYSPMLSGENGRLVKTEGVYDFSPYDPLFAEFTDQQQRS